MDLVFSRYADPFLFLNQLIRSSSLYKGLLSLIEIKQDELTWQMYCSLLANPMNKIKSYKDFKKSLYGGGNSNRNTAQQKELREIEVEKISKQSNNILAKFKPQ